VSEIYRLEPELATDMWLVICFALRSTDLQKIQLIDSNGHGFQSVILN